MSVYRYAGATLALAGFISKQQASFGPTHDVRDCEECRGYVERQLARWVWAQP